MKREVQVRLWQAYETSDFDSVKSIKADLAFFNDAVNYSHTSLSRFPVARANVLARHKKKFSPEGTQPLVDSKGNLSAQVMAKEHPDMYVGRVFHNVYRGVKERLYG